MKKYRTDCPVTAAMGICLLTLLASSASADFGVSNGSLNAHVVLKPDETRPVTGQRSMADLIGPDWKYDQGSLGLASPASLPPRGDGKQGLFVSGGRIPAIVTAYLGQTEEISDVTVAMDVSRRSGFADAHYTVLILMADQPDYENLEYLTGQLNPIPVYPGQWNPYELTAEGVPAKKHIYLRIAAKVNYRRHEEIVFSNFHAAATPAPAINLQHSLKPLFGQGTGRYIKPYTYPYRVRTIAELRDKFATPPHEAGPHVFWFMFDQAIREDELRREIKEMYEAGIAGAEMRFLRGVTHPDVGSKMMPATDHKPLEYLGPEFLQCMRVVCEESEKLGFKISFNCGTGWPPGGLWVTPEHQAKQIKFSSFEIKGPSQFNEELRNSMLLGWKLRDGRNVVEGSFVDLGTKVADGQIVWDVPEGKWLIGRFDVIPLLFVDKGEGWPADPGSAEAMRTHLDHVFARLDSVMGDYYGTTVVEMATDSWEYSHDNNWSSGMLRHFPEVAGYDLMPKMYAYLGYGSDKDQVMADVYRTKHAIIRENFFELITAYVNDRGLRHRPQAYGHGMERDLYACYAASDVPEVEEMHMTTPEATWVGHLLDKPLISVEAMTFAAQRFDYVPGTKWEPYQSIGSVFQSGKWHFDGRWAINPEVCRRNAALMYAKGVNRFQIHSYSYCPAHPAVDPLKWRMYAPIHMNGFVPWWGIMRSYCEWTARMQIVLQSGAPGWDVVVYPVRAVPRYNGAPMPNDQPISAANAVEGMNEYLLENVRANGGIAADTLVLLGDISVEDMQGAVTARRTVKADARTWQQAVTDARSLTASQAVELQYQKRIFPDGVVYFIRNAGADFSGEIRIKHRGALELWNADTGAIQSLSVRTEGEFAVTRASIPAADAVLIACVDASAAPRYRSRGEPVASAELKGAWSLKALKTLRTRGIESEMSLEIPTLVPWREIPELHDLAGIVSYRTEFTYTPATRTQLVVLHLGEVYEAARVRVNGQEVGDVWHYPYEIDITEAIKPGKNILEISVPNLWQNYEARTVNEYPRPSGLLGPVVITQYKYLELGN